MADTHFHHILACLGFDRIDLVEREEQYQRAKEVSRLYRKMVQDTNLDRAPEHVKQSVLALHQHSQLLFEYERILRKRREDDIQT